MSKLIFCIACQKFICQPISALMISAITLNYIGKGTVQWTEKDITYVQNGYRRKIDVDYGDEEEYFNVTQCISGGMGNYITSLIH